MMAFNSPEPNIPVLTSPPLLASLLPIDIGDPGAGTPFPPTLILPLSVHDEGTDAPPAAALAAAVEAPPQGPDTEDQPQE